MGFVVFALLLLLITFGVLGHFAWVLVAAMFGFKVRTTRREPPPVAADLDPIRTTLREISRLERAGRIDPQTFGKVVGAIEAEARNEAPGSSHPPAPPLPVIPIQAEKVAPHPDVAVAVPIAPKPLPLPRERYIYAPAPGLPPAAPSRPAVVRRSFNDAFTSFMDQNNIRWGELLGGLLIVGCSIALVISFWAGIAQRPWLQFSVFTAVTAAFFAVGLYSEHQWRLPTTSRGILLIATLLMPLNFLAFASFSAGHWRGPTMLVAEGAALALLTYLAWQSARVIAPTWPHALTTGVSFMSATLLLLGKIELTAGDSARFVLLWAMPLCAYAGPSLWMLMIAGRWRRMSAGAATAIFLMLGVLSFCFALALGLLVHRSGGLEVVNAAVAWPVSVASLPALVAGLLVWQRVLRKRNNGYRTAGAAVAVAGIFALLFGVALAWRDADRMLPIAIVDFIVLAIIAFLFDLSPAFIAGQSVLGAALVRMTISRLSGQAWFIASASPFFEPWTLQALAIVLAGYGLAWGAFRLAVSRSARVSRLSRLLQSARYFDVVLSALLLITLLGLAFSAALPACWNELCGNAREWVNPDLRAAGVGSWVLLGALLAIFVAAASESAGAWPRVEFIVTVWLVCPLLAAEAVHQNAAASTLRFACAGYLLAGSIVALFLFRAHSRMVRGALWILGAGPVLVLTLWRIQALFFAGTWTGPSALSFFDRLGAPTSYAIPLLVIAAVLLADAVAKRSAWRVFAASVVVSLAALLGYALALEQSHIPLTGDQFVRMIQIAAIVMAGFAVVWLAILRLLPAAEMRKRRVPLALVSQISLSCFFVAIILVPTAFILCVPAVSPFLFHSVGGAWGWTAFLLTAVAAISLGVFRGRFFNSRTLGYAALGLVVMIAASQLIARSNAPWDAFHTMLAGDCLAGWAMFGLAYWLAQRETIGRSRISAQPVAMLAGALSPISAEALEHVATPSPALETILRIRRRSVRYAEEPDRTSENPALAQTAEPSSTNQPPTVNPMLDYARLGNDPPPAVAFVQAPAPSGAIRWATIIGGIVFALAARALFGDPDAPWWSMGAALAMALLAMTVACWASRPGFLYQAGIMLNFAAFAWFVQRNVLAPFSDVNLLATQIIAGAIPGVAWLVLDLQFFRPSAQRRKDPLPAFHHVVAIGAAAGAFALQAWIFLAAWGGALGSFGGYSLWLAFGSLLAAMLLMGACLWDERAGYSLSGLYGLGIAAIAGALDLAGVSAHWLPWAFVASLSCYGLIVSALWNRAAALAVLGDRLGLPDRRGRRTGWLVGMQAAVAAIVVATALVADFVFEPWWGRLMLAGAAMIVGISSALRPVRPMKPGEKVFDDAAKESLVVFAIAAILGGWAWLPIDLPRFLEHAALGLIVLAVFSAAYGLLIPRVVPAVARWRNAARAVTAMTLGFGAVAIVCTLAAEANQLLLNAVPQALGWTLPILLTLIAASAIFLLLALRAPGTPDHLLRTRMRFVYASEILLALAFVHLRLTHPSLFGGVFQAYWPIILMAIAFAGVAAADILRRRGVSVLADPFHGSAIFLPLLIVIGQSLAPAAAIQMATLLLVIAVFYAIAAALRHSQILGAMAALAANGALWAELSHAPALSFSQHPQIWMIPGALCALAGAQLNRDRLSPEQLRTIRYAGLIVIYVSSTSDIFLNGVANSPWLPLVLAAFSVAGVLLGILLRIRAFLFLGASFLLLSVITMICYASAAFHWTWIWYVCGILLGAGILVLFALFEKKREQMLAALAELKAWQ